MRLCIVSDMAHHLRDGTVTGWGPTVQEISHLGEIFSEIRHVACLDRGPAPASSLPYTSERVTLVPLPRSGGVGLKAKLGILRQAPLYLRTIVREVSRADVVHVRCPANISLMAIVALALMRSPRRRWVKYAGNWRPEGGARSTAFQRWWLQRGVHRGLVTVNGEWPGQPAHVRSFLNPCLTEDDLREGAELAAAKEPPGAGPLRLLLVGRVQRAKGVDRALRVMAALAERGVDATLSLVGDGPERPSLEAMAAELGVESRVEFHGWAPRHALGEHYARAHVLLLPSVSEGWPKVLSEAMAYGTVPVASRVGSIPQFLARFRTGRALPGDDVSAFAGALQEYASSPALWREESDRAREAAALFTYSRYLQAVRDLLEV